MAARRANGVVLDIVLLSVFLGLVYVFVQRRGYLHGPSGAPRPRAFTQLRHVSESSNQNGAQKTNGASAQLPVALTETPKLGGLVDPRVAAITDVRPTPCRDKRYDDVQPAVSVIIDFFDYQFFDMKTTLGSVLAHTPAQLIREIIIIDDGSTLDYIIKEADLYVTKLPNARMLRNGGREGVTRARLKGAASATAPVLVFLDTTVVCARGWLEPLLQLIAAEKSVIAVPHYDSINDPVSYDYKSTANSLVTTFSWRLNVRMVERAQASDVTAPLASPVMRGNAFAVGKAYFETLGGYDEGFTEAGGENLELSLRAWMCGGAVRVVPCSRVGVLNLNDPIRVGSKSNIRRIAELWLGDMKAFVYRQTDAATPSSSAVETTSLETRRRRLSSLQCRDLNWYVADVAAGLVYKPTGGDVVDYGYLRVFNGMCASVGNDSRVDLSACALGVSMVMSRVFEWHSDGRLTAGGQCLAVKESAYVLADTCTSNDDRQKWEFRDKLFVNKWSQTCLMHVTDPDTKWGKRQIVMAQDCKGDKTKERVFVRWEFVRM